MADLRLNIYNGKTIENTKAVFQYFAKQVDFCLL